MRQCLTDDEGQPPRFRHGDRVPNGLCSECHQGSLFRSDAGFEYFSTDRSFWFCRYCASTDVEVQVVGQADG